MSSRSSAVFDLDDDGDLDIVTMEWNYHPQVLLSNLSEKKAIHYLKIKLVGAKSNRDGLGAVVKVHAAGKTYMQYAGRQFWLLGPECHSPLFRVGRSDPSGQSRGALALRYETNRHQRARPNRLLTVREKAD